MPPKKNDPEPGAVNTDSLAQDVVDEDLEYPEGTPVFIPVLNLPRMRRADAYEALGQIQSQQRQVKSLTPDDDEPEPVEGDDTEVKPADLDPMSYGAQYRVVAYIEAYLRVVAKEPREFDIWKTEVNDSDLVKVFNVFIRKTQPGEAEKLDRLIDEHGAALLYDLQGIGVDLREVFRGNPRVTPRHVLMLVGQLSDDSALAASVRGGPEFRSWNLQNTLLAAIANILNAANQQRAGKKNIKPLIKPPQKAKKRQLLTVAEIVARQKKDST